MPLFHLLRPWIKITNLSTAESEALENRLLMALLVSDIEKAHEFLDKGADKQVNIWLPSLYFAIDIAAPLAILELLIDRGFDVNYQYQDFESSFYPLGMTPLMLLGNKKIEYSINAAKLFLSKQAKINVICSNETTALRQAVGFGNIELTKLLINKGANINYSTSLGETPLILAAFQGNLNMVKLLVQHGADINQISKEGNALWYALSTKKINEELVRYLIEQGSIVDFAQKENFTPLQLAIVHHTSEKLICFMLYNGADINFPNNEGGSPLMVLILSAIAK